MSATLVVIGTAGHDVFDFSFSEVATALERSETACRKLASRAQIDPKHAQLMLAISMH